MKLAKKINVEHKFIFCWFLLCNSNVLVELNLKPYCLFKKGGISRSTVSDVLKCKKTKS